VLPDPSQVRRFFKIGVSSSLRPPGPTLQKLDVRLRARIGGSFFLFGSPCTLCDLTGATSSLRFDVTSSPLLRLHVDRRLVRHGYCQIVRSKQPTGVLIQVV
jgi:hypothetical protein